MSENKRINQKRLLLQNQKAELETKIKASQKASITLPNMERFVELIQKKISLLDFEAKRQVLDMLDIKVWLDNENIEISGILPLEDVIVTTSPQLRFKTA